MCSRIFTSSSSASANSFVPVYQFDFQSWITPTRNPPGWTFCPISSSSSSETRGNLPELGEPPGSPRPLPLVRFRGQALRAPLHWSAYADRRCAPDEPVVPLLLALLFLLTPRGAPLRLLRLRLLGFRRRLLLGGRRPFGVRLRRFLGGGLGFRLRRLLDHRRRLRHARLGDHASALWRDLDRDMAGAVLDRSDSAPGLRAPALDDQAVVHMRRRDEQLVSDQAVIRLRVRDGGAQHLLDLARCIAVRERKHRAGLGDASAADVVDDQARLARRDPHPLGHSPNLPSLFRHGHERFTWVVRS